MVLGADDDDDDGDNASKDKQVAAIRVVWAHLPISSLSLQQPSTKIIQSRCKTPA